jgi:hypothetical protein
MFSGGGGYFTNFVEMFSGGGGGGYFTSFVEICSQEEEVTLRISLRYVLRRRRLLYEFR